MLNYYREIVDNYNLYSMKVKETLKQTKGLHCICMNQVWFLLCSYGIYYDGQLPNAVF